MRINAREESTFLHILVVEDSDADVTLLNEAFEAIDDDVKLSFAHDGKAAMSFLNREDEYADVALPDIVLLDLGLPEMSGREVLETLKADSELRRVPVIVLTDTDDEQVVTDVYDKHANAYVNKFDEFESLVEFATYVSGFWGDAVTLPPHATGR